MEVEIVSVMQMVSPDPARRGQMDTIVLARFDGKRSDTFLIPSAVTDPKTLEKLITEEVKKRSQLPGHKFTIA